MHKQKEFVRSFQEIFLIILFWVTSSVSLYSQGGWDIQYISIDSLDVSQIGKEVRMDFKASTTDHLEGAVNALHIRKLLSSEDTISLVVSGKPVKFKERWRLYIDHGVLGDQMLESMETRGGEKMYVEEMYLLSINERSLALEILVSKTSGKYREFVVVKKSDIKGCLLRL